MLESNKMLRSEAENARIAGHGRRKVGSAMQAYIILYMFDKSRMWGIQEDGQKKVTECSFGFT